ncbi:hypothetical protein ACLOJK_037577 [Asimina triloba]
MEEMPESREKQLLDFEPLIDAVGFGYLPDLEKKAIEFMAIGDDTEDAGFKGVMSSICLSETKKRAATVESGSLPAGSHHPLLRSAEAN